MSKTEDRLIDIETRLATVETKDLETTSVTKIVKQFLAAGALVVVTITKRISGTFVFDAADSRFDLADFGE